MLPYKNLLVIDKKSNIAAFRQLASQFIQLIQEGKLLPGTKLPSTRVLANDLELHRKTVMAAYEALVTEDWVENRPRKGFLISPKLPVVKPRSYHSARKAAYESDPGFLFDSSLNIPYRPLLSSSKEIVIDDGLPDISLLPTNVILKEFRNTTTYSTLKKISNNWEFEGNLEFRNSLCNFLNQTRGLDIRLENILSTRGAQMAIYLAASLIIKPGDKVIVCEPSYLFANMVFERLGAELIHVPIDSFGMNTDVVEDVLKNNQVKLIYVIPHHHHPTTVTMSVERRNHLLQIIKKHQIAVIEDDYDYDFQYQYDPYLPLASGDHEGNIVYIGSLTKVLGAPYRLGYIVAAEKFITAVAANKILIDLKGDILTEHLVSGLIEQGELTRLIQKANKLYRQRCDLLSGLLNTELRDIVNVNKPNGGMALWVKFNSDFPLSKIINFTAGKGVKFNGSIYNLDDKGHYNALRFGFASLLEEEIIKTVDVIKNSIYKLR
ncbi:PLP-dependent aminotransferase family protein [Sphingobacterium siyangense]|uniref:aminotransferase-like domain-containing protein n=1 Tax=Sphingobacterium siyangense TaxID=459529 RepID=UPI003DA35B2F